MKKSKKIGRPRVGKGLVDSMGFDAKHRAICDKWRKKWGLKPSVSRKAVVRRLVEESAASL